MKTYQDVLNCTDIDMLIEHCKSAVVENGYGFACWSDAHHVIETYIPKHPIHDRARDYAALCSAIEKWLDEGKRSEAASAMGKLGGSRKSRAKTDAVRANARKPRPRIADDARIDIKNPWSDSWKSIAWAEIKAFAHRCVHESDRARWLRIARYNFKTNNGNELGKMIIGS